MAQIAQHGTGILSRSRRGSKLALLAVAIRTRRDARRRLRRAMTDLQAGRDTGARV